MRPIAFICTFLFSLGLALHAGAQENEHIYVSGKRYLAIHIRSLDKYAKRLERSQRQLLNKLKRKEQRLATKLLHTDSAAYARLKSQSLSFDSISRLAIRPDSATLAARTRNQTNKPVDSLKGVYRFVASKAGKATGVLDNKKVRQAASFAGYDQQLNSLQSRLAYDDYISNLTSSYGNTLNGIAGKGNTTGIQKELFYAKAKMAEWKKIADDPSKAEALALEYLQGTKGFDASLNQSLSGGNSAGTPGNAASATDLEAMGYQTKRQLNAQLQQKFGNNLGAVQGSVGKQVGDWQSKAQGLTADIKETRQSLASVRKTQKPQFKINPMRCLPFGKRVEKQYSFQTARAATLADGTPKPAILNIAGSLAYRQSPKLSAGLGIAGDIGLGQNWSSIRFSFEGVGARAFVTWEWQYGIGLYGGYERMWKGYAFKRDKESSPAEINNVSPHNTLHYSESVLLGLTKKYKINSKWNGAIQVLYDVWWQDKGLRSPVVLRIVNSK